MRILFITLYLLSASYVIAQKKIFYSKNGSLVDSVNSYFYEIIKDENIKTTFTYYTKTQTLRSDMRQLDSINSRKRTFFENGKIQSISEYTKKSPIIKHANYYQNGIREARFDYEFSDGNILMYILEYADSLGSKIIDKGNGNCGCNLYLNEKQQKEFDKGEVIHGLKNGRWEHWKGDSLQYVEIYNQGQLISGISYKGGNEINYEKIEEPAHPPAGLPTFYSRINRIMKYPKDARRNSIQGKVFIQFVIDKEGTITDVAVLKGIGGGCDEEAIKAVSTSPKWIPGKQRGLPVRQRMILPITFAL